MYRELPVVEWQSWEDGQWTREGELKLHQAGVGETQPARYSGKCIVSTWYECIRKNEFRWHRRGV